MTEALDDATIADLIARAANLGVLAAGLPDDIIPYGDFRNDVDATLQRRGLDAAFASLIADEFVNTVARVKAAHEAVAPAQTSRGIH